MGARGPKPLYQSEDVDKVEAELAEIDAAIKVCNEEITAAKCAVLDEQKLHDTAEANDPETFADLKARPAMAW